MVKRYLSKGVPRTVGDAFVYAPLIGAGVLWLSSVVAAWVTLGTFEFDAMIFALAASFSIGVLVIYMVTALAGLPLYRFLRARGIRSLPYFVASGALLGLGVGTPLWLRLHVSALPVAATVGVVMGWLFWRADRATNDDGSPTA